MENKIEKEKKLAAEEAVKFIESGQIIGLGTGSTVFYAVKKIGELVGKGLKIKAVSTSAKTSVQAAALNIPLIEFDEVQSLDLTIDGADEFDGDLNLIKGGGGALLKEKMVARISRREIIIADSSKKVDVLGKFKVPLEVTPFTATYVGRRIEKIVGKGILRKKENTVFQTDTGNFIIDADFGQIREPQNLASKLDEIEGVVCHGLFLGLADLIIMADGGKIITFEK